MSPILNVAVVGCGIGRSHIVEGYLPNADKFKVLALCDLNLERMTPVADEFAVERRITSFEDALAMDVDLIDLLRFPTIRTLAEELSGKSRNHAPPLDQQQINRIAQRQRQRLAVLHPEPAVERDRDPLVVAEERHHLVLQP